MDTRPERTSPSRAVVVTAATAVAVVVNVLLYAVGRWAGGSFAFTANGVPSRVDALTVAGFSAVPLGIGLVVVALLVRRWPWVARVAMVVAPALAVVTIGIMTLPADLDTVSTLTLAACHLALVPVSLVALRRLHTRSPRAVVGSAPVTRSSAS